MKETKVLKFVRVLYGLWMLTVPASMLFPVPTPEFGQRGGEFMGALFNTGYVFWVMALVFLVTGLSYVFGRYKALATLLVLPFSVNIALFHIFLELSGLVLGLIFFLLNILYLWVYKDSYAELLVK